MRLKQELTQRQYPRPHQQVLEGRTRPLSKSSSKNSSVQKEPHQDVRADIDNLSATELNHKYKLTYDSWRNMKQRRKTGAIIHDQFQDFRCFLRHMGPRPTEKYTLDRVDNDNPMYGPGLCQWRDKAGQANNRKNTRYLTHDGKCLPLTVWARLTNQNTDTLRKRQQNGWSDSEVVTGKRTQSASNEYTDEVPMPWKGEGDFMVACEIWWRDEGHKRYPNRYEALIYICKHLYDVSLRKIKSYENGDEPELPPDETDLLFESPGKWATRRRYVEREYQKWQAACAVERERIAQEKWEQRRREIGDFIKRSKRKS